VRVLSYFVTHPEVAVDPTTPVTRWALSDAGVQRAARLTGLSWAPSVQRIVASAEAKAQQTAAVLGETLGLGWSTDAALGENDRSATGFLPPAEFEVTADAFFAHPRSSVRGWETAEDAQRRVIRAVLSWTAVADVPTAYVSHGAVGTLLYCALTGEAIDRRHDQPGQGSWFAFDPWSWTASHPWRRIE
jgi:broad specificity phosphatase PhoE